MKWVYDKSFLYPSYDLLPDNYESVYEAEKWIYIKGGQLYIKGEGKIKFEELPEEYREIGLKLLIKGV